MAKMFQKTMYRCEISPYETPKIECVDFDENQEPIFEKVGSPGSTMFFIDFLDGPLQGVRLFSDIGDDGIRQESGVTTKVDEQILEDIMEAKKFMATPGIHQAIPRDLMVRIDSLLSCLIHRHGSVLDQINEAEEVKELASIIQKYTR